MAEKTIKELKSEIRAWKETCEILADKKIMADIKKSLKEIEGGKGIPLSKL